MATQRIAGVVIRRAGHSNCHFKFAFTNGSKISRTLVVKWLPPSSTAVIVLGNNPNTQLRWTSTQASSTKEFSTTSGNAVSTSNPMLNRKIDELDLGFMNHNAAFKSKSTWQVLRGYIVYQLCSIGPLVENNEKLMKLGKAVLGKKLFAQLMKMTFYGHFVAGEDRERIKPVIHKMHSFGVKSILDYSVEEDISEGEAKQKEMNAACPEDACVNPNAVVDKKTYKDGWKDQIKNKLGTKWLEDHIKRYKPSEKFGDRRDGNVASARTYFYTNEAACEKNMETFLRCIEAVADSTGTTGMAAIKVTALGRPNLLLQLSECITRSRRYIREVTGVDGFVDQGKVEAEAFSKRFKQENIIPQENPKVNEWLSNITADKKGLINMISWSGLIDSDMLLKDAFQVPNLKTGKMEPLMSALTEREEEQFANMLNRINTIFQAAKDMDVRVMVDAEQTYFQPAIHRLAMEMMKKYNTEKAIVFNTYQCYLKITYNSLVLDLEQADRQNFFFGAKLVRGAYMEQERARAAEFGYEDPVNPDYEATTEMYHKCLSECMQRMSELKKIPGKEQRVGIMVASHNADTVRFAIERMKQLGIKGDERLICFGQLLGMCDNLTFPLGQSGYSVYKYVPYGPVNEVLPYLSRRARENKGILQKLEKEKLLLRRELFDRIKKGQLIYNPKGDYIPVGFNSVPENYSKTGIKIIQK